MQTNEREVITIKVTIKAPVDKVWKKWTCPEDIMRWNNASEDWHTTRAENDLRVGGKFLSRMEAKDGSYGFDFEGIYNAVIMNKYIEYHIADGRKVKILFTSNTNETNVEESFETESTNPIDLQRKGWQAILDNFKRYTEEN